MNKIILYNGRPKIIITDRGTNFTSRLLNNLCKELRTKHKTTTAYHPQTNGMTERFNKTVVEMIRKYIGDGYKQWEEVGLLKLGVFLYDGKPLIIYHRKRSKYGGW